MGQRRQKRCLCWAVWSPQPPQWDEWAGKKTHGWVGWWLRWNRAWTGAHRPSILQNDLSLPLPNSSDLPWWHGQDKGKPVLPDQVVRRALRKSRNILSLWKYKIRLCISHFPAREDTCKSWNLEGNETRQSFQTLNKRLLILYLPVFPDECMHCIFWERTGIFLDSWKKVLFYN